MPGSVDQYLTQPDLIVLRNLLDDAAAQKPMKQDVTPDEKGGIVQRRHDSVSPIRNSDEIDLSRLKALNDATNPKFQPTVFVSWDDKDVPSVINRYLVHPYVKAASSIVRHPTDVVFLTHILMYFTMNLPSAAYLYYNFTWLHGIGHAVFTLWCAGSFTLMMHNHIHNNGVLAPSYKAFDFAFPYVLEPLMGHTWDSYYYHHVKHHHVEGNGPDDLSSTIRYQRDDLMHFLHYLGRFLFFIWLDLPLYFYRKNKLSLAIRVTLTEFASYAFMYFMTAHVNAKAATFTLLIPFVQMRLGLMLGNWGQHALVDEIEPDSDFRSSITLIDVPSNRFCFNDGYHTAHHLNPRRHWREQPVHFLQSKEAYASGRALVFHNIDYLMMTVTLLRKDYLKLADCLVPIGDQVSMTREEIAAMLKTKTRKFSEEEIKRKFKC
nr:hypothetical protein CFP56_74521 [Quercus suber]